jgi:hypothetical protein
LHQLIDIALSQEGRHREQLNAAIGPARTTKTGYLTQNPRACDPRRATTLVDTD